jgi:hypothetical protein
VTNNVGSRLNEQVYLLLIHTTSNYNYRGIAISTLYNSPLHGHAHMRTHTYWATLLLGDINTGTWPSRLGESQIWDSKMWPWVPWDLNPRITALSRTSSNCKWPTRPIVSVGAPPQQTCNSLTVIKIWSWAPDGCLTPRQTGWLTVGRNITLTLTFVVVR